MESDDLIQQTSAPRGTYLEVIQVAWPIVVSMLSYTLMGVVDTFLVARLGTIEVASVGLGTVAMFTCTSFGWGLLNAVKVVVSQAHGAGRSERCVQASQQGILLALILSAAILMLFPLSPLILRAMGGSGEVFLQAKGYFQIRLWGAAPMLLSIAAFGYFQGRGDTTTPMRVQVAANVLNIGLDVVLIYGLGPIPAMGIRGAALATSIAFSLQGAVAFWLWHSSTQDRKPLSLAGTGEILEHGLSMGLRFFLEILSFAVFVGLVARVGDQHLAAHTIVLRVVSVSFLPGHGIGEAAGILVGQAIGAGDWQAARRAARRATVVCLLTMGTAGLVFLFFGRGIVGLFRPTPEVLELASRLMLIAAAFQLFDGVAMVKSGALNGAGDTRFVMIGSVLVAWLVLVPLGYLLCNVSGWGAPGAWAALTIELIVVAVMMAARWEGDRVAVPLTASRREAQRA